jgi:hypothetical protein
MHVRCTAEASRGFEAYWINLPKLDSCPGIAAADAGYGMMPGYGYSMTPYGPAYTGMMMPGYGYGFPGYYGQPIGTYGSYPAGPMMSAGAGRGAPGMGGPQMQGVGASGTGSSAGQGAVAGAGAQGPIPASSSYGQLPSVDQWGGPKQHKQQRQQ